MTPFVIITTPTPTPSPSIHPSYHQHVPTPSFIIPSISATTLLPLIIVITMVRHGHVMRSTCGSWRSRCPLLFSYNALTCHAHDYGIRNFPFLSDFLNLYLTVAQILQRGETDTVSFASKLPGFSAVDLLNEWPAKAAFFFYVNE